MPPALPSSITMWVGAAVLLLIWQFFGGIFSEWGKRFVRGKNNPQERRRESDMSAAWLREFAEIQKQSIISNNNAVSQIQRLAEAVETLAVGMKERAEVAFDQHRTIIDDIHRLDVPRRATR